MTTINDARTPQDYAIEHAEYMAKDAERLIAAVNDLAKAEQERDEGTCNPSDVDAARETVSEMLSAVRSGIYEFRKRRDRALSAHPAAVKEAEPGTPSIPDHVLTYIHAYGDSRADDDGRSALRIGEAILAIRRWAGTLATPRASTDEAAGVPDESIEDLKRAYELLFKENSQLRAAIDLMLETIIPYREDGSMTIPEKTIEVVSRAIGATHHDSDCALNNRGVPELFGPCDCSLSRKAGGK